MNVKWGLVVHAGAGSFTLESLGVRAAPIRAAIEHALQEGHAQLAAGRSSVDAVEAAVVILEDAPELNAGRGAVFTHDGAHELDAAIMDGHTLKAGSVAGLRHVKNPIRLARHVMEDSPHVMLIADGAEAFAREHTDIAFVPESYFATDFRRSQLDQALEDEKATKDLLAALNTRKDAGPYFGTVGAVALDQAGNLAAATSTGGLTNKRAGRVSDSAIIGAVTYAGHTCAISATGMGEFFIRFTIARDICARVEYRQAPSQAAADELIHTVLTNAGGRGGVVGLDRAGGLIMSFNTTGMGRGYAGEDGQPVIMLTNE